MLQVQEYNGYLQNGRFISTDKVAPPDNVTVVVKVTGQVIPFRSADQQEVLTALDSLKEMHKEEQKAVLNFLEGIDKINENDLDEETLKSFEMWDNGEFKLDLEERLL